MYITQKQCHYITQSYIQLHNAFATVPLVCRCYSGARNVLALFMEPLLAHFTLEQVTSRTVQPPPWQATGTVHRNRLDLDMPSPSQPS